MFLSIELCIMLCMGLLPKVLPVIESNLSDQNELTRQQRFFK